ncbi:hypothetical protein N9137_03205 [Pseudomonadales bacterium]|nr:hypothetical protein [Pseudomonadales bacterium]
MSEVIRERKKRGLTLKAIRSDSNGCRRVTITAVRGVHYAFMYEVTQECDAGNYGDIVVNYKQYMRNWSSLANHKQFREAELWALTTTRKWQNKTNQRIVYGDGFND